MVKVFLVAWPSGKIAFYKRQEKQIRRYHVEDTEAEVARFEEAQETAIAQLGELYDKAMEDVRRSQCGNL